MKLSLHFLVAMIATLALYPFFGISALFVFIGGFLIDVDHILDYYLRYKTLNLKKAYEYYMKGNVNPDAKEYKAALRIFHTLEFVAIIMILSFFKEVFFMMLMGVALHFVMDIWNEIKLFGGLHNYSLIRRLLKRKAL